MRKLLFWICITLILLLVLPYSLTRIGPVASGLGQWVGTKVSAESGLDVEIGKLQVNLPFYLVARDLSVARDGEPIATAEKVRIAWSPLRLLQGRFSFPIVEAPKVTLTLRKGEGIGPPVPPEWPCSPIGLHLGNGRIDELLIISEGETKSYSLSKGELTILPKCGDFHASISIEEIGRFSLDGESESGEVTLRLSVHELEMAKEIDASLTGTLQEWHQLLTSSKCDATPLLRGEVEAKLTVDPYARLLYNLLGEQAEAQGTFFIDGCRSLHLVALNLIGDDLRLTASGELTLDGTIKAGRFRGEIFELSALMRDPILAVKGPLQIEGEIWGELQSPSAKMVFESPLLLIDRLPLYTPKGEIRWSEGNGSLRIEGSTGRSLVQLTTRFHERDQGCFAFPSIRLHGEEIDLSGSLLLCKDPEASAGRLEGRIVSLAPWSTIFNADLEGGGQLVATLTPREDATPQKLEVDLNARSLLYNQIEANALHIQLELWNPTRGMPSGQIGVQARGLSTGRLCFQRAEAVLRPGLGGWTFEIGAEGRAATLSSAGRFLTTGAERRLDIDRLSGSLEGESVELEAPTTLLYTPNELLSISPVRLAMAKGSATLTVEVTPEKGEIEASIDRFPLIWLSRFSIGPSLRGDLSGHLSLQSKKRVASGTALFEWEGIEVARATTPPISGWAQVGLEEESLLLRAHSGAHGQEPVDIALEFPLKLDLMPLTASVPPDGEVFGRIAYQGAIGPLTRTLLFQEALVEGDLWIDLALRGDASTIDLKGGLSIERGRYTNLRMGTTLANLSARAVGDGDTLRLIDLRATDDQHGSLTATGELAVRLSEFFPFRVEILLNQMELLDMEDIHVRFSGPLLLDGTTKEPRLSGEITVPSADLDIPERRTPSIPQLSVTYVNAPQTVQAPERSSRSSACALDLHLDIRPNVDLCGRGLESVWSGDLKIGGTTDWPDANGALVLEKGSFRFSDHTFDLVQGRMGFDGALEVTTLELVGTLRTRGIDVIATLAGPIGNPQFSIRSVPPLPLREVLSLVLFDAPIDEISPFQAFQLAAATSELSGGQMLPNPLRTIRSKLGLDRLTIVRPDESTDEIGIEAGRQIGRHGYLTLYRSLQTQYSHMLIELELYEQWQLYSEIQDVEGETFGVRWKKDY